jgi:hypothetical protein
MKHLTTRASPLELTLGIEARKPMDLTVLRVKGTYCEGSKNSEEMAKEREERKSRAMKFLRKCGLVMKNKPKSHVSTLSLKRVIWCG